LKIYFAGSIRGGREDRQKYLELIEFLSTQAEVLTEHVGSESLGERGETDLGDDAICQRDLEWLSSADAVVAEVTTPSLGVGYEIGIAEKLGKPILCLFDESRPGFRLSAMLSGNGKIQVGRYQTLGEAKRQITEFVSSLPQT
jgi:2'-deoxynucleoside 5'-phosphate N-hydrolase